MEFPLSIGVFHFACLQAGGASFACRQASTATHGRVSLFGDSQLAEGQNFIQDDTPSHLLRFSALIRIVTSANLGTIAEPFCVAKSFGADLFPRNNVKEQAAP